MLAVLTGRGKKVTPSLEKGRFFLRVRIGAIAAETKFTSPIDALVDTGARVSVVSPGLFESLINQGVDPSRDDNHARVGTIESQGVTYGTKIYQVRVGVELKKDRLYVFPNAFTSIHVLDTVLQGDGTREPYREKVGSGLTYVILGQDLLRQLRANLVAKYRPEIEATGTEGSKEPDRIVCTLRVVGERRTLRA